MDTDLPSLWPEHQRDFRERVEGERVDGPGTPVHWRAVDAAHPPPPMPLGALVQLVWGALRLGRRKQLNAQPFMALWPVDAAAGTPAALIFDVAVMPAAGEGDGVVLGELAMNGALCLVLADGSRVWPTYNPRIPSMYPERR